MVRLTKKEQATADQSVTKARYLSAPGSSGIERPAKVISGDRRLQAIVTPIWSREMGRRIKNARMYYGWDQEELGRKFRLSQGVVSRIERGLSPRDPLTLLDLNIAFEDAIFYILFGAHADKYETPQVGADYWKSRMKREKKGA